MRTLRPDYVGRYLLQFVWSDGHYSGIYTYEYLREMPEQGKGTA